MLAGRCSPVCSSPRGCIPWDSLPCYVHTIKFSINEGLQLLFVQCDHNGHHLVKNSVMPDVFNNSTEIYKAPENDSCKTLFWYTHLHGSNCSHKESCSHHLHLSSSWTWQHIFPLSSLYRRCQQKLQRRTAFGGGIGYLSSSFWFMDTYLTGSCVHVNLAVHNDFSTLPIYSYYFVLMLIAQPWFLVQIIWFLEEWMVKPFLKCSPLRVVVYLNNSSLSQNCLPLVLWFLF